MNRKLKNLKLEFFYLRRAFREHRRGFKYLYNRYFLAPKILKAKKIWEKPVNNFNLSIHVLTCHKDLIMTLWSLASFYRVNKEVGQLYLHNDGSLTIRDKKILNSFFPQTRLVEPNEVMAENCLTPYPLIKKFRENKDYFLLKKIIDTYFLSDKKYRLIIDTDLLWFDEPKEIENEIRNGCQNSLMMANNSFGYVYFKNGEKINQELASFNSGIVLYDKENFNLAKLEEYLNQIDEQNQKNTHFIEQAGFAWCLHNLKKMDDKKYVIKDGVGEGVIIKHYTSPRRPLFFIEGMEKLKEKIL
jgi:hypothetical protein